RRLSGGRPEHGRRRLRQLRLDRWSELVRLRRHQRRSSDHRLGLRPGDERQHRRLRRAASLRVLVALRRHERLERQLLQGQAQHLDQILLHRRPRLRRPNGPRHAERHQRLLATVMARAPASRRRAGAFAHLTRLGSRGRDRRRGVAQALRRVQGVGGRGLEERVGELLDLIGLTDAADRVVRGYSGGMKRRLDVGLGLVHRPQVLFLDEPTTGLDPEARASMWEELERLAEGEALTILLTTHYMEEADQLADRLAIVSLGRVVVEGTPEELKRSLRGEAVEVELSDGRAADAEGVVAALEGVLQASSEGRKLRSRVASGARAIPSILSALEAKGIGVEAVTSHRPSLDDVYLHYTGREFAAEHEAGGQSDIGEDGRG